MPLFVAVVVDALDKGEVYLRQQGNNQEYVTSVNEKLHRTLKPGTKVAVNNTLSIVKIIGNVFDSRIRVMELEEQPDVTFEHVGGLKEEIEEVREAVEYPLTKPEIYERIGVEPPKGILLYGPPGTGKTLIAKAVAHNSNARFIRMSGSELVHRYIGEGAQLVRELFILARERAPSIVFIDEIDAIGSMRMHDGTSGSAEVQRTLMQLLAEMDGFGTAETCGSWLQPTGSICSTLPSSGRDGSTGSYRCLSPMRTRGADLKDRHGEDDDEGRGPRSDRRPDREHHRCGTAGSRPRSRYDSGPPRCGSGGAG